MQIFATPTYFPIMRKALNPSSLRFAAGELPSTLPNNLPPQQIQFTKADIQETGRPAWQGWLWNRPKNTSPELWGQYYQMLKPPEAFVRKIAQFLYGKEQPGAVVLEGVEDSFNNDYQAIQSFLDKLCQALYQQISGKPGQRQGGGYTDRHYPESVGLPWHQDLGRITHRNPTLRILWYPSKDKEGKPVTAQGSTLRLFNLLNHQHDPVFSPYKGDFFNPEQGKNRHLKEELIPACTKYAHSIPTPNKVVIFDDRAMIHNASWGAGTRSLCNFICYDTERD